MNSRYGDRPDTPGDRPAPTLTSKTRSDELLTRERERERAVVNTRQRSLKGGNRTEDYKRGVDRPAPTLTVQAGAFWQWEQPATTVCADPRITARCHDDTGSQGRNPKTTGQVRAGEYEGVEPIKLTVEEALILQGFPPDWPVQGSRSKQFEQIGNAVPPPMAEAIIRALTS